MNKGIRYFAILLCFFGIAFLLNIDDSDNNNLGVKKELLHDELYLFQDLTLQENGGREFVAIIKNKSDTEIYIESMRYNLRYSVGKNIFLLDPPQYLYNITVPAKGQYVVKINASGVLSKFTHGNLAQTVIGSKTWYLRVSKTDDFDKINSFNLVLGLTLFLPGITLFGYSLYKIIKNKKNKQITI